MKQKQMTAVAAGCGAVCALCVAAFLVSVQGQADAARAEALARYGGEQVEVCVATRDIAAGERVELSSVETKLWVADLLPEGALRSSGDAAGRVATSSILKGEVISAKRFESGGNVLDVPDGKEAVSVPAKAVQAVGGAVRPGMSVDVYSAGDTTTAEIARSVLVLATSVGESGSLVASESGWITLAVEPEKVQELIAASSRTSLHFVIPGQGADGQADDAEGQGQLAQTPSDQGQSGQTQPESQQPDRPQSGQAQQGQGSPGQMQSSQAQPGQGLPDQPQPESPQADQVQSAQTASGQAATAQYAA